MGVVGQHHVHAAVPPGKTRYPLYRRVGVAQGRSGRVRKITPPPGFNSSTLQNVDSCYTDGAIPAAKGYLQYLNYFARHDIAFFKIIFNLTF